MDRAELEGLDRESLVARAHAAGIRRARVLTRPELIDELLRLSPDLDEVSLRRSRGFFGRARDLLSKVVERGLHLPDAADRLRVLGTPLMEVPRPEPQAVPTVTLAEIYAAQGHRGRAVETLERVLEREPDHGAARVLLERLRDASYVPPEVKLPPEQEAEQAAAAAAALELELEGERGPEAPTTPPEGTLPSDDSLTVSSASECVAVPLDATRVFVWWRVGFGVLGGPFVVRVLCLTPSWDGPIEHVRELVVEPSLRELVVDALPPDAVVRVAIGYAEGERFVPCAHSPALERDRSGASGTGTGLVEWTLDGLVPVSGEEVRRGIAVALQRARAAESA